jgi:hypothetical protein
MTSSKGMLARILQFENLRYEFWSMLDLLLSPLWLLGLIEKLNASLV